MYNPRSLHELERWTLADLARLPEAESDLYEYKSAETEPAELANKLARAASAFWNSGGGLFVAGVDGRGRPDGGVPRQVGRQQLRDWVDQLLATVTPVGPYAVARLDGPGPAAGVRPEHAVLAVGFGVSHSAPHMAGDKRYYIRAGAHTVPATHFIVESIRAQRGLERPWLECLLRHVNGREGVGVQLSVVAVNDSPALDVRVTAEPIDGRPSGYPSALFPKRVPLIDRLNPYVLGLNSVAALRDAAFLVMLAYTDVRGREYSTSHVVDTREQLGPVLL